MIAPRVRKFALIAICKSYRPALSLEQAQTLLAFRERAALLELLASLEVSVGSDGKVDCKAASQALLSKDTMAKLGPG
jgi:hypothetical protein